MKIIKEHINESIKHLKPRSSEEIEENIHGLIKDFFKNKRRIRYALEATMDDLCDAIGIQDGKQLKQYETIIKIEITLLIKEQLDSIFNEDKWKTWK